MHSKGVLKFGVKLALCSWLALPEPAQAAPIYAFSGGLDGANPQAILSVDGTIYGTTRVGGGTGCSGEGCGTIFAVDTKTRAVQLVYRFAGAPLNGAYVFAGLTRFHGELYGTTAAGGQYNMGTVFRFDPVSGTATVLHHFRGSPSDGANPLGGVIVHDGALYGSTSSGGGSCGPSTCGTVFKIDLRSGDESTLYSFQGGTDGAFPSGTLIADAANLYGTTLGGDVSSDFGTVFRIALHGYGPLETPLYRFAGGADGAYPAAALSLLNGNIFGTTEGGDQAASHGTAFRLNAAHDQGRQIILHRFGGGQDGALPEAPLIYRNGAFYGTTTLGGGGKCAEGLGCGTVFKLDAVTGAETILHDFTGGHDGQFPEGGLVIGDGRFYGTTTAGGGGCHGAGCGTVFDLPTR